MRWGASAWVVVVIRARSSSALRRSAYRHGGLVAPPRFSGWRQGLADHAPLADSGPRAWQAVWSSTSEPSSTGFRCDARLSEWARRRTRRTLGRYLDLSLWHEVRRIIDGWPQITAPERQRYAYPRWILRFLYETALKVLGRRPAKVISNIPLSGGGSTS